MSNIKNNLHLVLNAKGGIGKSTCSITLQTFLQDKLGSENVLGIDTDPNNNTLSSTTLNTIFLNIMPDGDKVDLKKFDDLTMFLYDNPKTQGKDIVLDCGSSTFQPLFNYLQENETIEMILNQKYNVYIHIPVTLDSPMEEDTLNGMAQIIEAFKDSSCQFIIWSNHYFSSSNNADIEKSSQYIEYKEKIFAVILMKKRDELFLADYSSMAKKFQTFLDIDNDPSYDITSKIRLSKMQKEFWDVLSIVIPIDRKTDAKKESKK